MHQSNNTCNMLLLKFLNTPCPEPCYPTPVRAAMQLSTSTSCMSMPCHACMQACPASLAPKKPVFCI